MEALKVAEAYCLRSTASAIGTGQENAARPTARTPPLLKLLDPFADFGGGIVRLRERRHGGDMTATEAVQLLQMADLDATHDGKRNGYFWNQFRQHIRS